MVQVTDFHTHIFPPWLRDERENWVERDATFGELFSDPRARMATAEDLVQAMDEDGVDRSVAMGMGWTDRGLAREANDYIIESALEYPDRIIGFCSVNPAWGEDAAFEVERCARAGLVGVGELHADTQGYDLGDADTMRPLLEVADEYRLVITAHTSEPVGHLYRGKGHTTPDVMMRFIENARAYSNVKIVCAHWGGGLPFYALMPEVKDALQNVWFDTAASPFLYSSDVFSIVANLVGADRILLGSDFPLLRFGRIREQIKESGMILEEFGGGSLLKRLD
ncbi:MAG: amidohydrolase family protein, partial [Dehalococcoidia bacterium]|nr:amidohydrolase family protein [Dehalococcoidia bacterium]